MAQGLGRTITFIHTRDRKRAVAFYRDVLGFAFESDDPFAAVFDLNGAALRITEIPDWTPGPHPALGWQVADIKAAVTALTARGVAPIIYPGMGQDELGLWHAPGGGVKLFWFHDPDGNLLSLAGP